MKPKIGIVIQIFGVLVAIIVAIIVVIIVAGGGY